MSRKERIEVQLKQNLEPNYLSVEDESRNHHVPKDAETHFKVVLSSITFKDLSRIARHRLVNQLLQAEFDQGMHALSLHLYTPEEWEKKQGVLPSPSCKDGYKNN
ncbi:MAG: BolA family transcriptional regulator [Legionella sp.]|nr:MAG: BolA family transcriptional regulator [Legionella sp.]